MGTFSNSEQDVFEVERNWFCIFFLIGGAYIALHDRLLENSQKSVEKAVVQAITPTIQTEVLKQLAHPSALLSAAQTQINKQVTAAVSQSVSQTLASPEFKTTLTDHLLDELDKTGGPQDIILNEALKRALDQDAEDSVRASGLQLYSLLHAGERTSSRVTPMRKNIVEILEREERNLHSKPKLLSAILEHYPLGEYSESQSSYECRNMVESCKDWDMRAVHIILSVLQKTRDYPVSKELFERFFVRITPALAPWVLSWIEENAELPTARHIPLVMARFSKHGLLHEILPQLALFASNNDDPILRRVGLRTLAALDGHAPIGRAARAEAFARIWESASGRELSEAFSSRHMRLLHTVIRGNTSRTERLRRWLGGHDMTDFVEDDDISHLLHHALVNLLRTQSTPVSSPSTGRSPGLNDWTYLIRPMMMSRAATENISLYAAWTYRMVSDLVKDADIRTAAGSVLLALPQYLQKNEIGQVILEFAVLQSSYSAFSQFSSAYVTEWLSQEPSASSLSLTSAVLKRDRESLKPYALLERELSGRIGATRVEHFLKALLYRGVADRNVEQSQSLLYAVAGRALEGIGSGDKKEYALAVILVDELIRRMEDGRDFWYAAAAVEDVGLLAPETDVVKYAIGDEGDGLEELRRMINWVGVEVEVTNPTVSALGKYSLGLEGNEGETRRGGRWYRLDSEQPIYFRIAQLPEDVEVLIMDAQRLVQHLRTSEYRDGKRFVRDNADRRIVHKYLSPGSYAIALRAIDDGASKEVKVELLAAPHRLGIGTAERAVEISESEDFWFESDGATGKVWLAMTLVAGDRLEVETKSMEPDEEIIISPYVVVNLLRHLSPRSYVDFLNFLESYDFSLYSRLRSEEAVVDRDELWEVARLGELFAPELMLYRDHDIRFMDPEMHLRLGRAMMEVVGRSDMVSLEADMDWDELDEARLRRAMRMFAPGMDLLTRGFVRSKGVDTHISLLERESRVRFASDDDGGQGTNARLSYQAGESEEVLIQISRCCTEPLISGDRFFVHVRLDKDTAVERDKVDGESGRDSQHQID